MNNKDAICKRLVAFLVVLGLIIDALPVNAASKMSGLDYSMKKNKTFYIDCYTPSGMKRKKVKLKRYKKKKLTANYVLNPFQDSIYDDYFGGDVNDVGDDDYDDLHNSVSKLKKILKFYDEFYSTFEYEEFIDEYNDVDDLFDDEDEYEDDYDGDYEDNYEDDCGDEYDEIDYDYEYRKIINKYYKKVLSKLEVVDVVFRLDRKWHPTMSEVSECCNTSSFYNEKIHFVDYKSGKSLITKSGKQTSIAKDKGVFIVCADWYYIDKTNFYNYDGDSIWLVNPTYYQYTIIKPKKYKNLCIGVSGDSQLKLSSADKKYFKGKANYKKTSWYTKYPDNSKWLRVK